MADESVQVVKSLLDYINSIEGLPAKVKLEFLAEQPPAMMLRQMGGSTKTNEDILGNYEAQLPFALFIRTWGSNENDRIDGIAVLNDIGAYFDRQTLAKALPDLGDGKAMNSITMTSFPSLFSRNEDTTEDYQALYRLEYEQIYD